jgi:hypothetical protein
MRSLYGDGTALPLPACGRGLGWGCLGNCTGREDRPSPTRRAQARNGAPERVDLPASGRGEVHLVDSPIQSKGIAL